MRHELVTLPDASALASRAAELVAQLAKSSVADHHRFTFAVSGGHTPWAMFAELTRRDLPWSEVQIFQVDERVAPPRDDARNLAHLEDSLPPAAFARLRPMPVEADELDSAAAEYAALLPERLDVVHLGLGPDGHTASLVPGDPVLDVRDRDVAMTVGEYQGCRRMTLTYPAIDRARQLVWLVTGESKVEPLKLMLARNPSIPAGRVSGPDSLVIADSAASEG